MTNKKKVIFEISKRLFFFNIVFAIFNYNNWTLKVLKQGGKKTSTDVSLNFQSINLSLSGEKKSDDLKTKFFIKKTNNHKIEHK